MKETVAVIPAFNEEKHIYDIVKKLKGIGLEVVVIDDCSHDETASKALSAGASVIRHISNMGYGAALQTGYKYAAMNGYSYLVQLDGDGQHEPDCAGSLLEPVIAKEADLCIGSRFMGRGKYTPTFLRSFGMMFFRLMLKALTGKWVSDPTSGFQAMNRKVFSYLSGDSFPDDYPDADVIFMLLKAKAVIKEVPVTMYYNADKSMHAGLAHNLYYMLKINLLLIAYCFKRIRKL